MKRLVFVFLLLAYTVNITAQQSVSGFVTDQKEGTPLIGLHVFVTDISAGVVTGKNGHYRIDDLPLGSHVLQFSYMGFKTVHKTIYVADKDIRLDIDMEEYFIEGDEVVISGHFASTKHDNTVKISTLRAKDVELSGQLTLVESLKETPGLNLISKGPGIGTPVIRGLSLSNILFLNNGIPIENYQFSENHPYLIDEYGIDRVEVIKGPSALIYGSGAVGGIINVIDQHVLPNGSIQGDFNLKYYGNTNGVNSNLGLQGNQSGFIWGLRAGINSNEDYRQGNGEIAENSRFNRESAKVDLGLIRKIGSFKINYQYNQDKLGMAVLPAFSIIDENSRKNEVWYQSLLSHRISSRNKIFINKFRLDIDLSYQWNNRQLKGSEETPEFDLVDMTLQTLYYQVKSSWSFSEKGNAIFGIQGNYQDNRNSDAPEHVLPDASLTDFSAFIVGQYRFGSQWVLEAGLRYSYRYLYVPLQEAGGHSHDEDDHDEDEEEVWIEFDDFFSNLSASAGATFNISDEMLIRMNLASAFRNPNIAELTQYGMHGIRFEVGNPELETQQNLEADLGYHLHTRHLTFDISAFYNNVFNYIHLAPTADTTHEGQLIYQYTQENAVLYGGEISFHFHPHPVHWLHLKSTYSYVEGRTNSGEHLPFIPAQQLNFEIQTTKNQWKSFRGLFLKLAANYTFAQNHPSPYETTTADYLLFNLSGGFDIRVMNQSFSFAIIANNLFDVAYYDHLSTLKPLGVYDMGRNVSVSLKIPFGLKKAD